MAALQCEICGGKLMGKPGGIFECDSCGMEYDTSWAKAKIQEIRGAVKVEGTVEVTGTVKVEGGTNSESLLKRGYFALEDKNWEEAKKHFNECLDMDAECAEGYLGLCLASLQLGNKESLLSAERDYEKDSNFIKAMRFADAELKAELDEILESFRVTNGAKIQTLAPLRKQAESIARLFARSSASILALLSDGTAHYHSYSYPKGDCEVELEKRIASWEKIVAVSAGAELILGLTIDGTVRSDSWLSSYHKGNLSGWKDITQIGVCKGTQFGNETAIGLKSDGTVITTGSQNVGDWTDIVSIFCDYHVIGLKADGSVVTTGPWDLSGWTDIVSACATWSYAVGLRSDGTVVFTGNKTIESPNKVQYDLSEAETWSNIIAIRTAEKSIVGLKADGTTVSVGWPRPGLPAKGIVAFHINSGRIGGTGWCCAYADGTVSTNSGKKDGWKLFDDIDNIESDRKAAIQKREATRLAEQQRKEEERRIREEEQRIALQKRAAEERAACQRQEEERKIAAQRRQAGLCQHCGGELRGLFSKKCVSCGKPKDY